MPRMPTEETLGQVAPNSPGVVSGPRDYIGPALQNLGQGIAQAGAALKAKQGEDDTLDLMRARADWNTRRLLEDDNYRLEKDPNYAKWEPTYSKNIKGHQAESGKLIRNPKVREKFDLETSDDITRGTLGVRERSGKIDLDKRKSEALQGIDTNMRLAGAPGTTDKERDVITERTRADIDNAVEAGLLSPAEAIDVRQKFVKGISVFRVQRDIEENPEEAYRNLKGNSGEIYYHKLRRKENASGSDYASPGTSSALGRYQFTSGTWAQVMKNHPELGLTADGRTNGDQQERAIRAFTNDNAKTLKAAGLPATEANLYLAHFMGSGGAIQMLKANPGAPAADLFPDAARANKTIFFHKTGQERTVGQVLALQTKNFSGAHEPTPDYYQYVDNDDRLRLEANAETEFVRRDNETKETNKLAQYEMGNQLEDDIAQIERTGQASNLDPATVQGVMGDVDTAKWLDARREASAAYRDVESIDSLRNDELTEHLEELEPEAGATDFDRKSKLYDKAVARADAVVKERQVDPAKSVSKAPQVKKAMEDYDPANPQSVQGLVRARLSAQSGVGIIGSAQNAATKQEASELFAPITNALDRENAELAIAKGANTPAERRASIKEIKARTETALKETLNNIEKLYGPYAAQVLTQAISQNFRNQADAQLMSNVIRKLNAGEKVTAAEINAMDSTTEAAQAEAALEPGGGGSWVPDWVTKPFQAFNPVIGGASLGMKMRQDNIDFAKNEKAKKAVGPFPPVNQSAVDALIRNPTQAEAFDKLFGPGSAEKWLPKKPVEASQ